MALRARSEGVTAGPSQERLLIITYPVAAKGKRRLGTPTLSR